MALWIGVKSGGTFTDVCLFEKSTGQIAVWKVSSTRPIPHVRLWAGSGMRLPRPARRRETFPISATG